MPPLPSVRKRLREGLADPFGCAPLSVQVRDKQSAMVVVADYTRNNAYDKWLPELLYQLNDCGIPDSAIQLYIGSGTHRPMSEDEKRACYTDEVWKRVEILDHDCDATDRMKKIGRTDYGTVIYVDQRIWDSEFLILTGGIMYHYFAGYSGGRKALMPGCCARETIIHNHSLAINKKTGGFDPRVKPGALVGNPVNEDMLQVASQIRPDMCVNVVLNSDKEISWLGVGDQGYKLRRGAAFLDESNLVEVAEPADIAIVGAGGQPKDLTLFQAHKSLRHSLAALKPGAKVFWLARAEHGEGTDEFQTWRQLSLDECQARVQREISLYAFCALSLKTITDQFDVHLISDLPAERVREWGMTPHQDIHRALSQELPANASGLRWAVIPDCSNLLPTKPKPPAEDGENKE